MNKLAIIYEALNLKTIRFNFTYFSWKIACKFPVLISRHTRIRTCRGTVQIKAPIYSGMIRMGFDGVGIFDNRKSRSIWSNSGHVIFRGAATLGHGTKICVGPEGILDLGNNFTVTAESQIIANKCISIGDQCLFSWNVLLMDTDFHSIYDSDGNALNSDKAIHIGSHVWIGCRTTILKGSAIGNDTVVAAGSLVTRNMKGAGKIIGGIPATIIKHDIQWQA